MGEIRKQIREVTGNKSKGKGVYSGRNEWRAGKTKKKTCGKCGDIWKERNMKLRIN
jgi:hypothetical protein